MERETQTIALPSGIPVVLHTYLIGREKRELTNAFLGKDLNVSMEGNVSGIDAESFNKAQEAAWRAVVVSLDGKTAETEGFNIVEAILDLRSDDYDALVAAVNEVTSDKKK